MSDAMTDHAREALEAARALAPEDQLEVIQGLAHSLARTLSPLAASTASFWHGPSLDEIIEAQGVKPVTNLESLKSGAWPEDESVDDFLDYIYGQRRADRDQ